ncbi:hypothetical protein BD309DRAFT_1074250, partial [Dichomitus squalens]
MPIFTSLLYLARILAEDSDPTVRLDLAPSLNWLSRRSAIGAIHSGQQTIEPIQFTTLLEELAPPNIPTSHHHTPVVCALCGMLICSSASDSSPSTPCPHAPSDTRHSQARRQWRREEAVIRSTMTTAPLRGTPPLVGPRWVRRLARCSLWGSMQRCLSGTPAVSKSQSTENVSTKISEPPKERPKLP